MSSAPPVVTDEELALLVGNTFSYTGTVEDRYFNRLKHSQPFYSLTKLHSGEWELRGRSALKPPLLFTGDTLPAVLAYMKLTGRLE